MDRTEITGATINDFSISHSNSSGNSTILNGLGGKLIIASVSAGTITTDNTDFV